MAFSEFVWAHDNKHWLNEIYVRVKGIAASTVTITNGSTSLTATIGTDGTVLVELPNLGVWSFAVTVSGTVYTTTANIDRYGITDAWAIGQIAFADASVAQIKAICDAGLATSYWSVGDRKTITMQDNEAVEVKIGDFGHDIDANGKTIPVTLIMSQCFNASKAMNTTNTNAGGWKNSNFRVNLLPSILANFPQEWQDIIIGAMKKSSTGSQASGIVETEDKLWMLSEIEIFGAITYSFAGEGTQYPIFPDAASRGKTANGVAANWWERSPYNAGATYFCLVATSGVVGFNNASYSYGVLLGFGI